MSLCVVIPQLGGATAPIALHYVNTVASDALTAVFSNGAAVRLPALSASCRFLDLLVSSSGNDSTTLLRASVPLDALVDKCTVSVPFDCYPANRNAISLALCSHGTRLQEIRVTLCVADLDTRAPALASVVRHAQISAELVSYHAAHVEGFFGRRPFALFPRARVYTVRRRLVRNAAVPLGYPVPLADVDRYTVPMGYVLVPTALVPDTASNDNLFISNAAPPPPGYSVIPVQEYTAILQRHSTSPQQQEATSSTPRPLQTPLQLLISNTLDSCYTQYAPRGVELDRGTLYQRLIRGSVQATLANCGTSAPIVLSSLVKDDIERQSNALAMRTRISCSLSASVCRCAAHIDDHAAMARSLTATVQRARDAQSDDDRLLIALAVSIGSGEPLESIDASAIAASVSASPAQLQRIAGVLDKVKSMASGTRTVLVNTGSFVSQTFNALKDNEQVRDVTDKLSEQALQLMDAKDATLGSVFASTAAAATAAPKQGETASISKTALNVVSAAGAGSVALLLKAMQRSPSVNNDA